MVLAGGDADIAAFDLLTVRAKRYFPVNPIKFSGLREVGKTVLLNRLRGLADCQVPGFVDSWRVNFLNCFQH